MYTKFKKLTNYTLKDAKVGDKVIIETRPPFLNVRYDIAEVTKINKVSFVTGGKLWDVDGCEYGKKYSCMRVLFFDKEFITQYKDYLSVRDKAAKIAETDIYSLPNEKINAIYAIIYDVIDK